MMFPVSEILEKRLNISPENSSYSYTAGVSELQMYMYYHIHFLQSLCTMVSTFSLSLLCLFVV